MNTFRALNCYNCSAIITTIPDHEIHKMCGLSFQCECCGHENVLTEYKFLKSASDNPYLEICDVDKFLQ